MDKKNELANKLTIALQSYDIPLGILKSEIMMAMTGYAVSELSTEIVLYDTKNNQALMQQFLISKKIKGCSERTIQFYGKELKRWDEELQKDFISMQADDIRIRIAKRQIRDKVTAVTINNELRALSSFCTWMQQEAIRHDNPTAKVDKVKGRKKKKKAFTEIEVEKMRGVLETSKDKAMFEILLSTGCRVSELARLRIDDVDGDKAVVHGKGNKDRTVYLNAKATIALDTYLADRRDNSIWLFPRRKERLVGIKGVSREKLQNWYKYPEFINEDMHVDKGTIEARIRRMGKKVGVKAHPHKFRRTCATWALKRGMPIIHVSHMLGHESMETTQIYLDMDEKELEAAHRLYVT